MRLAVALLALASIVPGTSTARTAPTPPDAQARVTAFARLYGVVRYYYPGDAAQQVDWNRFAVLGVHEARAASSAADLARRLQALMRPLGPGIDIRTDATALPPPLHTGSTHLVAWQYLGYPQQTDSAYQAVRTHRHASGPGTTGVGTFIDAKGLTGHRVRLRGEIRSPAAAGHGHGAGLWMKIHRGSPGKAFDGNTARPDIADGAWHTYSLTATVPRDALYLMFGANMALSSRHAATADIRHLQLDVSDGHGGWRALPIPALREAASQPGAWEITGTTTTGDALQWHAASTATPGYLSLRHAAVPRHIGLFPAPQQADRAQTIDLGAGLHARVMLALSDAQARPSPARASALHALTKRLQALDETRLGQASVDARQADVVVLWNTLRLFYPYQDTIHVDWQADLQRGLADAEAARQRPAQRDALKRLMVPLDDAHASIIDITQGKKAFLPINLEPAGADWVVIASRIEPRVHVGDTVVSIDGMPLAALRRHREALASGQPSSRPWKAIQHINLGPVHAAPRRFVMRHADGSTYTIALHYDQPDWLMPKLPAPIASMGDGIWYVDLARVQNKPLQAHIDELAHARAVIYDDRLYPSDFTACMAILRHLMTHAEHSHWMHIPHWNGPGGHPIGYTSLGWDLKPSAPHFSSRAIFLEGGNTISAAEAILGYVQDDTLGTIVGTRSRGVDGDIASITLPTHLRAIFTGMKVTHHDGHSRYQAIGTPPDVRVQQTLKGIQAGHDEVLDAALELARERHRVTRHSP